MSSPLGFDTHNFTDIIHIIYTKELLFGRRKERTRNIFIKLDCVLMHRFQAKNRTVLFFLLHFISSHLFRCFQFCFFAHISKDITHTHIHTRLEQHTHGGKISRKVCYMRLNSAKELQLFDTNVLFYCQ